MKTSLLLIASLALGTAAFAQDTAPTNAPNAGMPPTGAMPATPDSSMAPPSSGAMTPDSSATPPADPGMSAPAGGMSPPASAAPMASTTEYPRCSRTVTDKCMSGGGAKTPKARHKR